MESSISKEQFDKFTAFLVARHSIYLARKAWKPAPWTTDPVLREGHFCNIFRELDRVTIWIRENIREPFADHPYLWFMLCIARYINRPQTLAHLLNTQGCWPSHPTFKPENMTALLADMAARGETIFTGAYLITPCAPSMKPESTWPKYKYISETVLGRLWEDRKQWGDRLDKATVPSLQATWDWFQQPRYVGWGPFMAYEVVTDLRHTRYLRNAFDIYTWANAGPGAFRGLNRLHGRPLTERQSQQKACEEMQALWCDVCQVDTKEFNDVFGPFEGEDCGTPRFEMRDIEHSLCEFDKWCRVTLGQGQMRMKYHGRV